MSLPPLDAFTRATTNLTHVEVRAVEPRPAGTLVRLSNWMRSVHVEETGGNWREADRLTALYRWTPELLGRCAGWSVRLREPGRPAADVPVQRDVPFVQAALDRGLAEPLMRPPLGNRVTRSAAGVRDQEADGAVGLDYRAGHLVARVRSHEDGATEIAQLEAILAAAVPLLDGLAPAPEAVDAHHGPDKPREIPPGATDVGQAAEWMQGPKRFLRGREAPSEDAALSGFAASYAAARGFRSEYAPHADLELPRFGVPARVACSVVGTLPDGRPARLAHVRGWLTLGAPDGPGRRVESGCFDVAVVQGPAPARDGVWQAGPYAIAAVAADWRRPTAAGLDAALRLLG